MVAGIGSAGAATFAMNVQSGATVTFGWQTDILKAWNGLEQRISMLAKPRQSYDFTSLLTDAQHRSILATLARTSHEAPVYLLGIAYEQLTVVSSTSTTITVHSLALCDWDEPGQRIVVVSPLGVVGEAVVQSSADATITIDADLTAMAVRGARIMPAQGVYLDTDQVLPRYPTELGAWQLRAQADRFRYGSAGTVGNGAAVATYESLPVWDRGIEVQGSVAQGLRSGVDRVDLGAKISALQAYAKADWTRPLSFTTSQRAEWQWFKKFLDTVMGRRVAFLVPTGRPDLVPTSDASTGTLTVDATDVDYLADWFPSLAHRRIKIVKTDGTSAYRTISSAEDDGATQDLVLDSSLAGAIDHVEFLETARLQSDEVSVSWGGNMFRSALAAVVVQQ